MPLERAVDRDDLPPADGSADPPESATTQVPMTVHMRGVSLTLIALLASLWAMRWAAEVFIPLLAGVMVSYALSPAVDWLERRRLPRAVGSALLLLAGLGGLGFSAYSLSDEASALVESLPEAAQKLHDSLRSAGGRRESAIGKVQRAATKLEQAAEESGGGAPSASRGVTRVQIERPHFDVKDYLWSGTLGAVGFVGQVLAIGFIAFFLMAAGDHYRRKLVKIAGPTFARRRITIQVLDEITGQIQRYLLTQLFTSVLVGAATWIAFLWLGLEHAAVWGAAAAVLNLVPYLGSLVVSGGAALVAFLQFGTLGTALLVAAVSLGIHTVSGNLLTPWLTSRASRMNPAAIFVGVLAWGWLWGIWGLLLGAPLLMIVKSVCDRVDGLKPVGALLGD